MAQEMDNCCGCTSGAAPYTLYIAAYKQWRGWWPFGHDPATELLTKKYRKLKVRVDIADSDPQPVCTGSAMTSDGLWSEAEYEYDQFMLRAPMAGPFGWGYEPSSLSLYTTTFSRYTDISDGGTVKLTWDSGECASRTVTDPYSAYGSPGFTNFPFPLDCTEPASVNHPALNIITTVGIIVGNTPDSTTVVNDYTMVLVYSYAGTQTITVTLTLSDLYTQEDLMADCNALLAEVTYGDTVLVGVDDAYTSRTVAAGDLELCLITEQNLCESGSVQQAFTVTAAGPVMPASCWGYSQNAIRYWDGQGAYMCKSRTVLVPAVTACKLAGSMSKSLTDEYTCGSVTCLATGLSGTIDVTPSDVGGLGIATVKADEPCPEC
jgi:hypothetical protein